MGQSCKEPWPSSAALPGVLGMLLTPRALCPAHQEGSRGLPRLMLSLGH